MFCIVDEWVKCDDDKMLNIIIEQILKFFGGGKFFKFFLYNLLLCFNNDDQDYNGMG